MEKGDRIYVPRFCTVTISEVFETEESARLAGFTEPTYYSDSDYGILGKSEDMYHMTFAGYKKEGK